jgi:DNA repair protein RecN (Recombination protein N)
MLEQLERLDPPVAAWRGLLDTAWANLDELNRTIAAYLDSVTDDPDRLATLERRRDLLGTLARKHGGSIGSILDVRRDAVAELALIDTSAVDLATLERRVADATAAMLTAADELTHLRTLGAARLAGEVTRQLPALGLGTAKFQVVLRPLPGPGADGREAVVFEAALNAGMAPRPIATAASGGELSRLMLALKVAVTRHDTAATLVFDEIDQGIGGETGSKVGSALAAVAERHQVLVITHLPQIAARADHHLLVAKGTRAGVATSDVMVLHGEDRIVELARMLGDADDANARRLAASMAQKS